MIIVEGIDGSGKTTLANEIAKQAGREVTHLGGPPKTREEIVERLEATLALPNDAILDRCVCISEPVYRQGVEGVSILPRQLFFNLLERLSKRAPLVIVCCRLPKGVAEGRVLTHKAHKPEEFTKSLRAALPRVREEYERAFTEIAARGVRCFDFDRTFDRLDFVASGALAIEAELANPTFEFPIDADSLTETEDGAEYLLEIGEPELARFKKAEVVSITDLEGSPIMTVLRFAAKREGLL